MAESLTAENNTKTSYSIGEWATAEAAGLVCLPVAGRRSGSDVFKVGIESYYWSSTADRNSNAYGVFFNNVDVYLDDYGNRDRGSSVRLITECQ